MNGNYIFWLKQTQNSIGWLRLSSSYRDWCELFSCRCPCSQNAYPHQQILPQIIYLFNLGSYSTGMTSNNHRQAHRSTSYLKSSMFTPSKAVQTIIKITPTCLHLCRRPLVAYKLHAFSLTSSWLRHQDFQHQPHFSSLTRIIAWEASVNTSHLFCISISFSWSSFDIHGADLHPLSGSCGANNIMI